jgi:hypothetical protein
VKYELPILISNLILKGYSKWPFRLLPGAKFVNQYINDERKIYDDEKRLDEYFRLEAITKFIIIPIEKRFEIIEILNKYSRKYGQKSNCYDINRLKKQFEDLSLFSGGWSNPCAFNIKKKESKVVDFVIINVARIEESLLLLSLKIVPSDDIKYMFYQSANRKNEKNPILLYGSLKSYLTGPGFIGYSYNYQTQNDCKSVFDKYNRDINNIFRELSEISLINIPIIAYVCYSDGPKAEERNEKEDIFSWNQIGLVERCKSYIGDVEGKFYLDYLNRENSKFVYCFINTNKVDLESIYTHYYSKIFLIEDDMKNYFVWGVLKDIISDTIYNKLNEVREYLYEKNNHHNVLGNIYLKPYEQLVGYRYVFERIFENNKQINEKTLKWHGIDKIKYFNGFSREISFDKFIFMQIDFKTKKIRKILKDIQYMIEGLKTIRNDRSNFRIQMWLFILTVITVIIGIIQIVVSIEK